MAPSVVRIEGIAELHAALERLPDALREIVVPTIATGAAIIESEAKTRVPYDEGDLERSIETEIQEDGLRAMVGSDLFYAKFVELGTSDTPEQPYLFPAFRTGARYVRRRMREWASEVGAKVRLKTRRPKK